MATINKSSKQSKTPKPMPKPMPLQPAEPPEPLGLHLEVQHPKQGRLELHLSEKVALKLAPWLMILLGLGGGAWFWVNYIPHTSTPSQPAAELQSRK